MLSNLVNIIQFIIVALGTVIVERSFSVTARVCSRLRQRLTAEQYDLIVISTERLEISRNGMQSIAYFSHAHFQDLHNPPQSQ